MLALAQAEHRVGDRQAALDWIARVESSERDARIEELNRLYWEDPPSLDKLTTPETSPPA